MTPADVLGQRLNAYRLLVSMCSTSNFNDCAEVRALAKVIDQIIGEAIESANQKRQ